MAGCRPEYFSTLRAIAEAACIHEYNLNGMATTTGPSTPMIVINGPMRKTIGMNSGRGVLGTGTRANASIGRALRLLINNVGGAKPGVISKSIHAQPGRYTFCIAEDEERSPWEPLHVTLGFDANESAVHTARSDRDHQHHDAAPGCGRHDRPCGAMLLRASAVQTS